MGADMNVLRRGGADFWSSFVVIFTTILLLGFSGHGVAASKMYFTEAGPTLLNLQRANTDGTSLEVIVPDDGVNNVHEEMFVDPSANMLYFVDDRLDALPGIYKVDLTGTFPATPTLVIEHDGIKSMVFDSANGRIYYTTANAAPVDYALYRCNLDGTNKTTLIPDDGVWSPTDLWLDEASGTLFVANLAGSTGIVKIATSSLPTTTASLISVLPSANRVESIYGYSGKIYYNDLTNFVLKRINFDGTGDEVVIADDAAWQPEALYVDDTTATLYLSDTAAPSIRKVSISSLPSGTTGAAALTQVIAKKALAILVHNDNVAPTIGGTAAGYTSNDTATVSPFPAVTIGDADGNNVTTIVTLDSNAKGVFTPASLTASGFTGNGPYTLAATSPATAQTKIRQLVFDPADNRVAPTTTETTTFTISVDDGIAAPVTDNTTTVISTSVNDAPTISGTPATGVGDDVPYSLVPTASDVDGDTLTFNIVNKPAWANFNTSTGALTGTPTSTNIGTTTGIVISVSDGSLSASLAAFDLEVYPDLDNDNIADSIDTDDDGDGMSDNWENANGLNSRDASDAGSDLDGDGVSNLDEFLASSDPTVDDYPPVVTPPADVNVDAVGLFTAVSTGTATAVDGLDGSLTPTSDAPTQFTPGVHIVFWSATDAAGNTGTAIQTVNVVPQISFSKHQVTAEGGTVDVRLTLNGPAVNYPVTIPYTVGGTAATDGSDHTLADGSVVFAAGTEAVISFTTVDDGAGEGTEQIVITMGTPTNAVPGATAEHTIDVMEGNVAPVAQLSADQGSGPTMTVVTGNGPVTVSSTVNDPNVGDVHGYDWTGSDNALSDTDIAADTFTFDPSSLAPGLYTLRLSVSDGTVADDALLSLNVLASAPSLSAANDSDGDGVDDAAEGYGDADGDGVADYMDAISSINVLQELSGRSDSFLIETEAGLSLSLGSIAFRAGLGQAGVTMSDVTNLGGAVADDARYDGGLFDFVVELLPVTGQSIRVVLPQQAAIPAGAHYRKLSNGLWQDFVVDAANSVSSAAGERGYCPSPGDAAYTVGLTEGHWCVQLTLEDGGPNDADGLANNSVADPGGVVGAATTQNTETLQVSSGGGSGSPWLLILLGVLLWRAKLVQREAK